MADCLSQVREGYDRWATVYDSDANPLVALEQPLVQQALDKVSNQEVLDLGCGTGRHALWLAENGARVTAVDFSEGMLDLARKKPLAQRVCFLSHDLHLELPFEKERFDTVVSGLVLEHLQDIKKFFSEVNRVLNCGGRAVVSAMHPAMFLRGSQARFTDPESGAIIQPGSIAHSVSDFVMAALEAGFLIHHIGEYSPDARFAVQYPRAEKYVDWPMLVVLQLRKKSAQNEE